MRLIPSALSISTAMRGFTPRASHAASSACVPDMPGITTSGSSTTSVSATGRLDAWGPALAGASLGLLLFALERGGAGGLRLPFALVASVGLVAVAHKRNGDNVEGSGGSREAEEGR